MSRRKISRRESLALLGTSAAWAASGRDAGAREKGGGGAGGARSAASGAKFAIVQEGRGNAVIVVEANSGDLNQLAARELQKYVEQLTGTYLEITSPEQVSKEPKERVLLVVGGPQSNSLVKRSSETKGVDFEGLKAEGFILKTVEVEGHPAVVVPAATDQVSTSDRNQSCLRGPCGPRSHAARTAPGRSRAGPRASHRHSSDQEGF